MNTLVDRFRHAITKTVAWLWGDLEAVHRATWLFLYLAIVFSYIKIYKYNLYLGIFSKRLKAKAGFALKKISDFGEVNEFLQLVNQDILLGILLAMALYAAFRVLSGRWRKWLGLPLLLIVTSLSILLSIIDAQVFKFFLSNLNLELLNIGVNWPLTLLTGPGGGGNTNLGVARSLSLTILAILGAGYILYARRFRHSVLHRPWLYRWLAPALALFFVATLALPMERKIGDIEKNVHLGILREIGEALMESRDSQDGRKLKLAEWPQQAGAFAKFSGLPSLDPDKTNIVVLLLESSSYKYISEPDNGPIFSPFLYDLRQSPQSIAAEYYFTLTPHSSVSRASILTGGYIRPDRYFRANEIYDRISLVSFARKHHHEAYYLHTCDLKFENQKKYYTNMGMKVFDKPWFLDRMAEKPADVGWGLDDKLLVSEGMREVLAQTRRRHGAERDRPFMVVFSHIGPHFPYGRPRHFRGSPIEKQVFARAATVHTGKKSDFPQHAAALRYQDTVSRELFDLLRSEGELENTLFIVVADHGESFYEHGYKHHNFSIFNEEARIPFFLVHPSFAMSKRHRVKFGSHLDVFPTILDIFGQDTGENFHGTSIFDQKAVRRVYQTSWTNTLNVGYLEGFKKYIYNSINDSLMLFDVKSDPSEINPHIISEQKQRSQLLDEFRRARIAVIRSHDGRHRLAPEK